jgi:hypothetical protein
MRVHNQNSFFSCNLDHHHGIVFLPTHGWYILHMSYIVVIGASRWGLEQPSGAALWNAGITRV